ncbi:hypothetical protein HOE67_02365 [Candidatus Peregrinibacteria bacterium]|nr:hypothetical protein [Candidatus Peregrinibacteria bacterium]MBT4055933.1 hypothetical protein [Candidatus Peregrinibacteria bacterium]
MGDKVDFPGEYREEAGEAGFCEMDDPENLVSFDKTCAAAFLAKWPYIRSLMTPELIAVLKRTVETVARGVMDGDSFEDFGIDCQKFETFIYECDVAMKEGSEVHEVAPDVLRFLNLLRITRLLRMLCVGNAIKADLDLYNEYLSDFDVYDLTESVMSRFGDEIKAVTDARGDEPHFKELIIEKRIREMGERLSVGDLRELYSFLVQIDRRYDCFGLSFYDEAGAKQFVHNGDLENFDEVLLAKFEKVLSELGIDMGRFKVMCKERVFMDKGLDALFEIFYNYDGSDEWVFVKVKEAMDNDCDDTQRRAFESCSRYFASFSLSVEDYLAKIRAGDFTYVKALYHILFVEFAGRFGMKAPPVKRFGITEDELELIILRGSSEAVEGVDL